MADSRLEGAFLQGGLAELARYLGQGLALGFGPLR
jgi:hypothetical protein